METAQLAFGSDQVQVNPFWGEVNRLGQNLSSEDRQRIFYLIQFFLEIIPEQRRNKVIVAHEFPGGVGLGHIPSMGTVIIKPNGEGNGYAVVSHLSLADWSTLDS